MTGTLHLVGVGPGDPELLTLRAVRLIGMADVLAWPQKTGSASQAHAIAARHIRTGVVQLPVDIPMERQRGPAQSAYDAAAKAILAHLLADRNAVYLCEGDPLFYGSAMYLIPRIAPYAPIEVTPGVTSLTASAAAIVRPIAARDDVLKVIPATLSSAEIARELKSGQAFAIIKPGAHLERIRALLETSGLAASAVIIEHATQDTQRMTPLRDFGAQQAPYFATILCYGGDEKWSR